MAFFTFNKLKLMKQSKIAIQGISGAFHEVAAKRYFNKDIEVIKCDTFRDLCESLKTGVADNAIMAIENTLAGSLLPNYALLREYNFKIIGEVFLRIQMNIMALPETNIQDIEFVYSHPIALGQCSDYLLEYPYIKVVEKYDTAGSAQIVSEKKLKNVAAIASKDAAQIFNLNILDKGIETNKKNYTRFLILSKKTSSIIDSNKASICLELAHYPGSLSNILNIFTKYEINLTKIQSIPIIGKPYEYSFHIDLEWDNIVNYEKAIHLVLKDAANLSILGEYKKGQFVFSNGI